jgi:hypothetical protein
MNDIRKTVVGWSLAVVVLAAPVLVRADQTPSWKSLGPNAMVFALAFDPVDKVTLYAGSQGAGLYKIKPGS